MLFEQRAKYAHALAGSYGNPATATWAAGSPSLPDAGPQRSGSGSMSPVRTRSSPSPTAAGEAAERDPNAPQSDEDIIMVTVRLSNKVRRGSYDDPLPERPRKRGFIRRMSTRILPPPDEDRYTAVKMPRGDYKRYFARDKDGNYAGSEPQREWDEEDIKRDYAQYQNLPMRPVEC